MFENFTKMYDQLLNIHEVPEEHIAEFLDEANNILKQLYRVSDGYKRAVRKREHIEEDNRRVSYEKRAHSEFN